MTLFAIVAALCILSAVLGRLVLTFDQARRTLTVRLPALALVSVTALVMGFASAACALIFFMVGSFYGLSAWWWPAFSKFWTEDFVDLAGPVVSGSWE